MSDWISVAERLPLVNAECIVLLAHRSPGKPVAYECRIACLDVDIYWRTDVRLENVAFWIPVPALPEVQS